MTIPVMLLPDDFKAYSKLKVDNHLFNKLVFSHILYRLCHFAQNLSNILFQGKHAQSLQSERILSSSVPQPS